MVCASSLSEEILLSPRLIPLSRNPYIDKCIDRATSENYNKVRLEKEDPVADKGCGGLSPGTKDWRLQLSMLC